VRECEGWYSARALELYLYMLHGVLIAIPNATPERLSKFSKIALSILFCSWSRHPSTNHRGQFLISHTIQKPDTPGNDEDDEDGDSG
jgi:hypothetical protein